MAAASTASGSAQSTLLSVSVLPYLPEAAFFFHVLPDGLPNATLGEEGAAGGQLELLVAAVSLQGHLHDVHRLPGEGKFMTTNQTNCKRQVTKCKVEISST